MYATLNVTLIIFMDSFSKAVHMISCFTIYYENEISDISHIIYIKYKIFFPRYKLPYIVLF